MIHNVLITHNTLFCSCLNDAISPFPNTISVRNSSFPSRKVNLSYLNTCTDSFDFVLFLRVHITIQSLRYKIARVNVTDRDFLQYWAWSWAVHPRLYSPVVCLQLPSTKRPRGGGRPAPPAPPPNIPTLPSHYFKSTADNRSRRTMRQQLVDIGEAVDRVSVWVRRN